MDIFSVGETFLVKEMGKTCLAMHPKTFGTLTRPTKNVLPHYLTDLMRNKNQNKSDVTYVLKRIWHDLSVTVDIMCLQFGHDVLQHFLPTVDRFSHRKTSTSMAKG